MHLNVIDFGGEGPAFLLLHGLADRASTWASTASWLTDYGRVIAYDARGHGSSDKPDGPYDREAHVGDAERMAAEYGPAIVIGHSMGGLTAWQLAARRPDLVRGIVIGDMTATPAPDLAAKWAKWIDSWPMPFASLADARAYFGHENEAIADCLTESPGGWHLIAQREHLLESLKHWQGKDFRSMLGQVTCPALVVAGGRSHQPVETKREMAELLPDGRFAVLPESGHVLHRNDPAGWRAAVEPFVARLH